MKIVKEYINEKFTEDSDPIHDMEIGHDAQMKKLNKQFKWDWDVRDYPYSYDEKIIDIIEHRGYHLKIVHVIPKFFEYDETDEFYIAITDIGEPYYGDGPYKWKSPEEAIKSGKSSLDNYIDD